MNKKPDSLPFSSSSPAEEKAVPGTGQQRIHAYLLGARLEEEPRPAALLYLFALTLAEVVAVLLVPVLGILLYFLLLLLLLLHAAVTWERPIHRFFLALTLVPLIRIISYSLPLLGFDLTFWFLITSVPLFVAAYVVMRQLRLSWGSVGVTWRGWPLQLLIGLSGIGLGYLEYLILRPDPLVATFTWAAIWLPALILLISTGFLEEYIFRGIMQKTAVEQLGRLVGISYVALFFAVLHIGYRSVWDFVFVLVVGLAFGIAVQATRSVIGVTLAHGLTNITLFLVFPFVLGNSQGPLLPVADSAPNDTLVAETFPTPISPSLPADLPSSIIQAEVTTPRLNAYRGPSLDDEVIARLAEGERYEILGRAPSGSWLNICCFNGDQTTWVVTESVLVWGELERVPIIADMEDTPVPEEPSASFWQENAWIFLLVAGGFCLTLMMLYPTRVAS